MGLTYTFHGHACFTLASDDATLLFDPFLTGNPAAKATADQLAADYILLSHGHFDHMPDTVSIAQRTGATVRSPAFSGTRICCQLFLPRTTPPSFDTSLDEVES